MLIALAWCTGLVRALVAGKDAEKSSHCWHPQVLFEAPEPSVRLLPAPWTNKLDTFQQLAVLRCLRPDRFATNAAAFHALGPPGGAFCRACCTAEVALEPFALNHWARQNRCVSLIEQPEFSVPLFCRLPLAIAAFVAEQLGQQYVEPPPFDLDRCYKDSNAITPLIFVLSPGSDPMASLFKFADSLRVSVGDSICIELVRVDVCGGEAIEADPGHGSVRSAPVPARPHPFPHAQVESISLGQGQGPKAAAMIEAAQQKGGWVVLQVSCSWARSCVKGGGLLVHFEPK